ncbi:MAG: hypothetical protein K940chlam7_00949 [Chlamydiae bacterium]|nr:hypothetical protein [Chlamydiota bacterium]
MSYETIHISTHGEGFYSITDDVRKVLNDLVQRTEIASPSGILHLFVGHTSCAMLLSEDYDPSAKKDLESFLKHLAPRNLPFIQHTLEGEDDSPSHMKSALLHQNLACIVEGGELLLGTWQGIFLAEFRDASHRRKVLVKFSPDSW